MGSASSKSPPSLSTALVPSRPLSLHELIVLTIEGNREDPYALLGFERYSNPSKEQVDRAFRQKAVRHHPDKLHDASDDEKLLHKDIFLILSVAHHMLLDLALKAKYDELLKRTRDEWSWWDFAYKNGRKLFSGVLIGVGLGLVIASLCTPAGVAAGAIAISNSVIGSAALSAGTAGLLSELKDPHQSTRRFVFNVATGALAGAALAGVAEVAVAAFAIKAGGAAAASALVIADGAMGALAARVRGSMSQWKQLGGDISPSVCRICRVLRVSVLRL